MSSGLAARRTAPAPAAYPAPDPVDERPTPERGRRLRVLAVEAVLLLLAALDVTPWAGTHLSRTGTVLAALSVAGFLLRRRWPALTWALGLPAVVCSLVLITPLITVFGVAYRTRRRTVAGLVALVTFAAYVVAAYLQGIADAGRAAELQTLVIAALYAVAPTTLAQAIRARGDLTRRLRQVVAMQAREQSLLTYTAVADERARLAREMHDVVSHQVGLIALQAGALRMTTTDPDGREAAEVIRGLASRTLDELRGMVGALRGSTAEELAPQPTLADIERLVGESGLVVRLTDDLPAGQEWSSQAQRAVFRTVQEGLTNARKHAPGAVVHVHLTAQRRTLRVLVRDEGAASLDRRPVSGTPAEWPSGGHGLLGLRERAELLGGRLTVRPNDLGGTDLRVDIPDPRP